MFTFEQLDVWLGLFLLPLFRLAAFLMTAPVLGHSSIPTMVKIGLAVMLTTIIAPTLGLSAAVTLWSWEGLAAIITQVLIGAALGLCMRVVFAAAMAAGDFIGLQMGLAFATFVSPDSGANTMILARFFNIVAILLFLAINGHLMVVEGLFYSFQLIPVHITTLNPGGFELLVRFAATIFSAGLLLALPLTVALLIVNLSLGILNRSAPQMTVFSVGFPTSLTLGILLLGLLSSSMGRFLNALFERGLETMQHMIELLAPL